MTTKLILASFLMPLICANIHAQSPAAAQKPLKFMGREVTVVDPGRSDQGGHFPNGPATVCIEGPPQRQCYTAPGYFGGDPTVSVVELDKDTPAMFFSAAGEGASEFPIHFALLRPGTGKDLENIFPVELSISSQGQHAVWNEPTVSDAPIFLTADYVWGPDEGHYGAHRYMISAYVRWRSLMTDRFDVRDRYMTVRRYDVLANADVLASEKPEILARLRRVKAELEPRH